ncbi:hypothetical protein EPIR_2846 [Erwinia piriflorinigrans CFBP 5888]|uniref:Uncharacterized protein n=1 Tax=Erwinia piriflorinigrans CFBP 5888 TaxID=1161919 RepID=V5ZB79_9GAMM|nr:hypothetical protein EPIR_2846 [Erwinia piriflorinigrans CFBP 5888]
MVVINTSVFIGLNVKNFVANRLTEYALNTDFSSKRQRTALWVCCPQGIREMSS